MLTWFIAVLLLIGLLGATAVVANFFARPITAHGLARSELTYIGVLFLLPAGIAGVAYASHSMGITGPTLFIFVAFTVISSCIIYFCFGRAGYEAGMRKWEQDRRRGRFRYTDPLDRHRKEASRMGDYRR